MKTLSLVCTVMVAFLVFAGDALAKGPGSGQGGGGGGEDVGSPPDFGDLVKLYRDDFGVPILTDLETLVDPETDLDVEGGLCQQPLYFPSDVCTADPSIVEGTEVVAVDPASCAILIEYTGCTEEVDFGRISIARSPVSVLESLLDDVIVKLATADCRSLDAAGRLVASTFDEETLEVTSSAIDSPGQNLAIYRQLMLTGDLLGAPLPDGADVLNTAARGLGAASDKGGEFNVDLLVYLNQILGLDKAADSYLPQICIDVREEVQGNIGVVNKCFLNYGGVYNGNGDPGGDYDYTRASNFSTLPNPAYIRDSSDNIQPGWFEVLGEADSCPDDDGWCSSFVTIHGSIRDYTFGNGAPGSTGPGFADGNIGGFAQAADDTRAVIEYMHSWPVPADYQASYNDTDFCTTASGDTHYDLSISEESGLQVPVQMTAPTEGRELLITVSNAGPDEASGTIFLSAVTASGGQVALVGEPDSEDNFIGPEFVFEFSGLKAGTSAVVARTFSIGEPYVQTTISWTAEVVAAEVPGQVEAVDVNPNNNVVEASTNVRVTGGGGRR